MSRKLLIATHNQGKLREFSRMLTPLGIEPALPECPGLLESIEENGATFAENALIKARAVFEATGLPAVADDSGICIDPLGGEPGVRSARYLGEDTPYPVKNAAILERLKDVPDELRTARFTCAIALVTERGEHVFEASCEGKIGYEPRGERGFGYDPIFYVGEKSFSELTDGEKDAVSHRGKALQKLLAQIGSLLPDAAVSFRRAVPGDEGLILSLIRQLAQYEKMADQVVATEELLHEWLFEKKKAQALFALKDGREAGMALYFYNFSTFLGRAGLYLEDLFVLPEARGTGCGKGLLRELARIAVREGCGRLDWACLDWNAPSIDFYRALGAEPLEEWTTYRLEGETLRRMAESPL